ncbi:MAG: hypothetical protein A3K65_06245 [Euryarchaeota archaeon RBG_16_68_12]|nr:MAG: hypothetical protein A3K65_06245 [Euryarchaeota archaeon RBG_16_68_12]
MLVDSSALIPLSRVGRLDLLHRLYRRVRSTRAVYRECVDEGAARPGVEALARAFDDWIEIVEVPGADRLAAAEGIETADASLVAACRKSGEALLSNDDHLLRVARAHGIKAVWLTSVVIAAARKGLLGGREAQDLMARLVEEGLRLSPEVFAAVVDALQRLPSRKGR